ncbi:hypothetical protein BDV98DRAFT_569518 [Pterulicium gracile]|uniref:Uncharacterized protein n=1 Tax=Pterulicium gracile TaxID=1884261 RepID=A0A5C3QIH8_9AGAR|nr:hypothetical protein BDV98DRAFT_569518 [Pterula gracilis]
MSFAWFFVGAIVATWMSRSKRRSWRFGRRSTEQPTMEQLKRKQKIAQIREAAVDLTLEAIQTARIKLAAIRTVNANSRAVLESETLAAGSTTVASTETLRRSMEVKSDTATLV